MATVPACSVSPRESARSMGETRGGTNLEGFGHSESSVDILREEGCICTV